MKNELDDVCRLNPTLVHVLTCFNWSNSTDSYVDTTVVSKGIIDLKKQRKRLDDEDFVSIWRNIQLTFPESLEPELSLLKTVVSRELVSESFTVAATIEVVVELVSESCIALVYTEVAMELRSASCLSTSIRFGGPCGFCVENG